MANNTARKPARQRVSCDQCEMLSINGVACHEIGCPNMGAKWEDGEWVRYYECFTCGCDVREGETCSCNEPDDEPDYDEGEDYVQQQKLR